MPFIRKYGVATVTATHIYIPIVKRDVVDFATDSDWTPAAGDVKISKNGAAPVNIGTLPVYNSSTHRGWKFVFALGELEVKQLTIEIVDSATKAIEDQHFSIETWGNVSAMTQGDLDDVATETKQDIIDGNVDDIETLLNAVDVKIDIIDTNVDDIETLLNTVDGKIDIIDTNVDDLELHHKYKDGFVYFSSGFGAAGAVLGTNGTYDNPCNSATDAKTLADLRGKKIRIDGTFNSTAAFSHYILEGLNGGAVYSADSDPAVDDTLIKNLKVSKGAGSGFASGSNNLLFEDCRFAVSMNIAGIAKRCGFFATSYGLINTQGFQAIDCYAEIDSNVPDFDMSVGIGANEAIFHNFSGHMSVSGQVTGSNVKIHSEDTTVVTITSTAGDSEFVGIGNLTDSSGGTHTLVQTGWDEIPVGSGGLTESGIADAVWDEQKAGHVAANSFGKILQDLETNLAIVDGNVDDIETLLNAVDAKIDIIDTNVDDIEALLNVVDGKIDIIDTNVDDLELHHKYKDGFVYIDVTNGAAGTVVGVNGTYDNPSNTLADAVTLVGSLANKLAIWGSVSGSSDINNFFIRGMDGAARIFGNAPNGGTFTALGTFFEDIEVAGDIPCNTDTRFLRCLLDDLDGGGLSGEIMGTAIECLLKGRMVINGAMKLIDCSSFAGLSQVEFGGVTAELRIYDYAGPLLITNMDTPESHILDVYSDGDADITLDATNTNGSAFFTGIGNLTDNSAGTGVSTTDWAELPLNGTGLTDQQVRDAMKLAPTAGAPAAGSIDIHLDDLITTLDIVDGNVDDIETLLNTVNAKIDIIDTNVDDIETLLNTVDGKIDVIDTNVDSIQVITDKLPIKKNVAMANFYFVMFDTNGDAVLGDAANITPQVSKDGAAYVPVAGTVTEVGLGSYKVALLAGETNFKEGMYVFTSPNAATTYKEVITESV